MMTASMKAVDELVDLVGDQGRLVAGALDPQIVGQNAFERGESGIDVAAELGDLGALDVPDGQGDRAGRPGFLRSAQGAGLLAVLALAMSAEGSVGAGSAVGECSALALMVRKLSRLGGSSYPRTTSTRVSQIGGVTAAGFDDLLADFPLAKKLTARLDDQALALQARPCRPAG